MALTKPCFITVDFVGEGNCESAIKMALFVSDVYKREKPDDITIGAFRYDRACSLVPCIKNLLNKDAKKPFLPSGFKQVWTPQLLDNTFLDGAHTITHPQPQCNIDYANDISECKYDYRLNKFKAFFGSNSQASEQTWNVWGPGLASITRHTTQHRAFWVVYLFKEVRNEYLEKDMIRKGELVRSGLPSNGGFLECNWNQDI